MKASEVWAELEARKKLTELGWKEFLCPVCSGKSIVEGLYRLECSFCNNDRYVWVAPENIETFKKNYKAVAK